MKWWADLQDSSWSQKCWLVWPSEQGSVRYEGKLINKFIYANTNAILHTFWLNYTHTIDKIFSNLILSISRSRRSLSTVLAGRSRDTRKLLSWILRWIFLSWMDYWISFFGRVLRSSWRSRARSWNFISRLDFTGYWNQTHFYHLQETM